MFLVAMPIIAKLGLLLCPVLDISAQWVAVTFGGALLWCLDRS